MTGSCASLKTQQISSPAGVFREVIFNGIARIHAVFEKVMANNYSCEFIAESAQQTFHGAPTNLGQQKGRAWQDVSSAVSRAASPDRMDGRDGVFNAALTLEVGLHTGDPWLRFEVVISLGYGSQSHSDYGTRIARPLQLECVLHIPHEVL